jgi:hypothetical protein
MGLRKQNIGPWPDVATARLFLAHLIDPTTSFQMPFEGDLAELGAWLIAQEIGPLAYSRWPEAWSNQVKPLKIDVFSAIAQTSLHFERLQRVGAALGEVGIPFVVLKGVALAQTSYPDPTLRTMSDVDIWVRAEDMEKAYRLINQLGFTAHGNERRPPKLQALAHGEIQFYDNQGGLVELHWSPVSGWLLQHSAVIDLAGMWDRTSLPDLQNSRVGLGGGRILAAEDMIIQIALHTAVNHRFRLAAIRSFIDIALTVKTREVNWQLVVERSEHWRVKTAVWCTLNLVQQLIGLPGAESALRQIAPTRFRRFLIKRFVSASSILAADDLLGDPMQNNLLGYLFLLLLTDRPIDALLMIGRALWPTKKWLSARYGEGTGHWQHIRYLLRRGRI